MLKVSFSAAMKRRFIDTETHDLFYKNKKLVIKYKAWFSNSNEAIKHNKLNSIFIYFNEEKVTIMVPSYLWK